MQSDKDQNKKPIEAKPTTTGDKSSRPVDATKKPDPKK